MAGRFSIEAIFKASDQMSRVVGKISGSTTAMMRRLEAGMRPAVAMADGFGRALKRIGVAGVAAGVAVGAVAKNIISAGADFEQAITSVGAVGLQTRDQIADLEKKALELGASTKFTATEAANAMEVMARAGFSNQEILGGISGVLDAAAASGLEIAEVADHVSNALKGMGLETSEASRVADVLALASSRTNSSIGSLGESVANVASTARQLKIPFEDVVASVASLQDVGLEASVAGSSLNTMLTKLAKPPAEIAKQMKKFGISFKDAKGNMLPFQKVIANISEAAERSGGNFDQVAFLADLVGLRGQKAAANLKDLFTSGKLQTLTKELEGAQGAAAKMAALKMDNLKGDFTLLESAIDGVKVALFSTEGGPLRDIVKGMTAWVTANKDLIVSGVTEFIAKFREHLPEIVKWGKRIGIIVGIFGSVAAAVKVAMGVVAAFNLLAAANPYVLIGLAIVAALALVVAFWPEISGFFSGLWDKIKDIAGRIGDFFSAIWSSVVSSFQSAWSAISSAFTAALEFIVGLFTIAIALLRPIWQPFVSAILLGWELIKAGGALVWEVLKAVWSPAVAFFTSLWEGVSAAFSIVWDAIVGKATAFFEIVKAIWAPIAGFFSGLWASIADSFRAALGWVIDKVDGIVSAIRGVGRAALGGGDAQVVSPQERVARSVSETTNTTRGEVTIRDTTGKAAITRKPKGMGLNLQPSGAF